MLAYAGQGVAGDDNSGSPVRGFLGNAAKAISGLVSAYDLAIKQGGLEPKEKYKGFRAVLERDAQDSLALVELVLAQPRISSLVIDNLNASVHLRALLTDLFLVDEVLKLQTVATPVAP